MEKIEIYFDGYCPESLLTGKMAEMKLNKDDFWESEATGLQIAVFSPWAVLLNWRGNKTFRLNSKLASDVIEGLVMVQPLNKKGKEIFPDIKKIITSQNELKNYLKTIHSNLESLNIALKQNNSNYK